MKSIYAKLLYLSCAAAFLSIPARADVLYDVSFNTSFLNSDPYVLDIQFLMGDPGNPVNVLQILNSNALAAPITLTDGNAALGTPPTATNAGSYSGEVLEGFAGGAGAVDFEIDLTDNADTTASPDVLSFYVYDYSSSDFSLPVATTDGSYTLISFTEPLDPGTSPISVATFDTPAGNQFNATVTPVLAETPEPGTFVLAGMLIAIPAVLRARKYQYFK